MSILTILEVYFGRSHTNRWLLTYGDWNEVWIDIFSEKVWKRYRTGGEYYWVGERG